jgi:WD40 repeat protein
MENILQLDVTNMPRFTMLKLVKKYGMINIFVWFLLRFSTLPAEVGLKSGKKNNKVQNQGGSGEKEDSYVRSVCFSPDGNYLVAGVEDKTVKVNS